MTFLYNPQARRIQQGSNDRFIPNRARSTLSSPSTAIRDLLRLGESCDESAESDGCSSVMPNNEADVRAIDAIIKEEASLLPSSHSGCSRNASAGLLQFGNAKHTTRNRKNTNTPSPRKNTDQELDAHSQEHCKFIEVKQRIIWPFCSNHVPGVTALTIQGMGLIYTTLDGFVTIHDGAHSLSWYTALPGLDGKMTCFSNCKTKWPKLECVFGVGDDLGAISVCKFSNEDSIRSICYNGDHEGPVRSVVFYGREFFSGGADKVILYHESTFGDVKARLEGHAAAVVMMALNQNQTLLASADEEGVICIWRIGAIRSGLVSPFRVICVPGFICALDWSTRDANLLACAEPTGVVSVWDAETGTEVKWADTDQSIVSLCWSRLSRELIVGGQEEFDDGSSVGCISIWSEKNLDVVCKIEFGECADTDLQEITLSNDGERLCCMSQQGEISIVNLFEDNDSRRIDPNHVKKRQQTKELLSPGLVLPGFCVR
jgi:WD40 repeat protein